MKPTGAPVIEGPGTSVTKGPEGVGGTTPEVAEVRHCVGDLTFAASPAKSKKLRHVKKMTLVRSPKACALECYAHGCTEALYNSSIFHTSEFQPSSGVPCELSFNFTDCSRIEGRVSDTQDRSAIYIGCVECCEFFICLNCD